MDLKCQLVTRLNKEKQPYEVIVIKLTDTYEKLVFLDSAEKELVKIAQSVKTNTSTEQLVHPFDN